MEVADIVQLVLAEAPVEIIGMLMRVNPQLSVLAEDNVMWHYRIKHLLQLDVKYARGVPWRSLWLALVAPPLEFITAISESPDPTMPLEPLEEDRIRFVSRIVGGRDMSQVAADFLVAWAGASPPPSTSRLLEHACASGYLLIVERICRMDATAWNRETLSWLLAMKTPFLAAGVKALAAEFGPIILNTASVVLRHGDLERLETHTTLIGEPTHQVPALLRESEPGLYSYYILTNLLRDITKPRGPHDYRGARHFMTRMCEVTKIPERDEHISGDLAAVLVDNIRSKDDAIAFMEFLSSHSHLSADPADWAPSPPGDQFRLLKVCYSLLVGTISDIDPLYYSPIDRVLVLAASAANGTWTEWKQRLLESVAAESDLLSLPIPYSHSQAIEAAYGDLALLERIVTTFLEACGEFLDDIVADIIGCVSDAPPAAANVLIKAINQYAPGPQESDYRPLEDRAPSAVRLAYMMINLEATGKWDEANRIRQVIHLPPCPDLGIPDGSMSIGYGIYDPECPRDYVPGILSRTVRLAWEVGCWNLEAILPFLWDSEVYTMACSAMAGQRASSLRA